METTPTSSNNREELRHRAFNIAEVAAMTPEEARRYGIRDKDYWDACTLISEATKRGIKEGREEGIKEGIKIGIAEEIAEGRAEGRAEMQARFALNLANKGMTMDFIVDVTGLTEKQVHEIISNSTRS